MILSNGIVSAKPNVTFAVRIGNLSGDTRILAKSKIVGYASAMPDTVIEVDIDGDTVTAPKYKRKRPAEELLEAEDADLS